MNTIQIYTDGACKGNPGPGGWGALLIFNSNKKEIYGGEESTTNNRMELTAVIKALEIVKISNVELIITTDSQYVKNGVEQWLSKWKTNNWRTSAHTQVKNIDLWQKLDKLIQKFKINWVWTKSHNNHIENERADYLANLGIPTDSKTKKLDEFYENLFA